MKPTINGVYYLASPYSTPKVRFVPKLFLFLYRHHVMSRIAKDLIKQGYLLIEPISMCFYKSLLWDLPQEYGYWKLRDREFINRSDGVIVCDIKGWEESVGVTDEVGYNKSLQKPVYLVNTNLEFKKL